MAQGSDDEGLATVTTKTVRQESVELRGLEYIMFA